MTHKRYWWYLFLLVLPLCSACHETGSVDEEPCTVDACETPDAVTIASVKEIGFIEKPDTVGGRDGAQSAALDGKLTWIFGDTFFGTASEDGVHYRTITATIASVDDPLRTTEALDANGVPYAALPWTEEEIAYNEAGEGDNDRIALWNGGLIPDETQGNLLGFYEKIYLKPSGWETAGIGTARYAPGETTGTRAADFLFIHQPEQPLYKHAMLAQEMVYLYGNKPNSLGGGYLARAPLTDAESYSAYTYWDGSGWSHNITDAVALTNGAPGDMTVAYNPYLERFVGIYSAPLSNKIMLRTAYAPQGPWSDAQVAYETPWGADHSPTYVGTQHVALAKDNGQRIYVTYSLPTDCFLCGEVVLVEITFE